MKSKVRVNREQRVACIKMEMPEKEREREYKLQRTQTKIKATQQGE